MPSWRQTSSSLPENDDHDLGGDLDLWRHSTDFSYRQVEVPAKFGGNGFSYLKGWVTEH